MWKKRDFNQLWIEKLRKILLLFSPKIFDRNFQDFCVALETKKIKI